MECDKVYVGGEGPFVDIALKRYYVGKEGGKFATAAEAGDGYAAKAEIGLQLTIPTNLRDTGDNIRDAACAHSFTRKAQEHFQAVLRSEGDMQAAVDSWTDTYGKLIQGEREKREGGGSKIQSDEVQAIHDVAKYLKKRHVAKTLDAVKHPVPRLDNPPLDAKGNINFNAWAKILREEGHSWYNAALAQIQKTNLDK